MINMKFRDLFNRNKKLDSRILEKKKTIEGIIAKANKEGRFSLYEFLCVQETFKKCEELNDYEKYMFFYDLVSGWDSKCHLTRSAGEYINEQMNSVDNVLAIHRANLGEIEDREGIPFNSNLNSIMSEGLINNGHGMQGAFDANPSLALTTSPMKGFSDLINLVSSYKSNNVTVLLQFPKELVSDDLSFKTKEPFYTKKDNLNYIDPNYILGAIVKRENDLDELYTRDELLKSMDYTK